MPRAPPTKQSHDSSDPGHDESRSALEARAAPVSDEVPGGDGGSGVDAQEGRLAAIEAPGHLLSLAVRQRKDVGDELQASLCRLKVTGADVAGFRETYRYHNQRDPWLEQPAQGN
jgi:hypothetical protein